jgi:hypothetical protein
LRNFVLDPKEEYPLPQHASRRPNILAVFNTGVKGKVNPIYPMLNIVFFFCGVMPYKPVELHYFGMRCLNLEAKEPEGPVNSFHRKVSYLSATVRDITFQEVIILW